MKQHFLSFSTYLKNLKQVQNNISINASEIA